jgi:hypothetical protein
MTKPVQPLKFTNFLLKRPVQCLKMMGSRHVSQFYVNSKLELGFSIYIYMIYDKEKFLILDFFKKFSPLNAIMT